MKNTFIILSSWLLILSGCAGFQGVMKNPFAMDAPAIKQYIAKAAQFEQAGDLRLALQYWEVIYNLTPEKQIPSENIHRLKKIIGEKTDAHLKKGTTLLEHKMLSAAQQEFLTVLRLDPDNTFALDFLTREINGDETITYKVKPGDTFESIATEVYNDPEFAFLIKIADPTPKDMPLPDEVLILPHIEKKYQAKPDKKEAVDLVEQKVTENLNLAKTHFKEGKYETVLSITEGILENDSENTDAYNLTLDAYYEIGKKLKKEKKYSPSLAMFEKLTPEYKDVKKQMAELDAAMIAESEVHYRLGLKHFINEDLNKAIQEWEKALALNPANEKAKKDIEDARRLMEKLKQIN